MKVKYLSTNVELKSFIDFYYKIYKNDPGFVDTDSFVMKDFLFQKTDISRNLQLRIVAIESDARICQGIFFASEKTDILYLGYFDCLKNSYGAVNLLIDEGKKIAIEYNKKKIVVGINGHISCGVGIQLDNFKSNTTFDSRYSKPWYQDYFKNCNGLTATTYIDGNDLIDRFSRIPLSSDFEYRYLDLKKFDEEMTLLSDLCNQTLSSTSYYYLMEPYHMKEMLIGLKFFLKKENVIFVTKDKKEIGFIFWHPDYNTWFRHGKKNSMLGVLIRSLFKRVHTCKINAIGVVPEYQNSRALLISFREFARVAIKYSKLETTFIWDNNLSSMSVASKRMSPHKHYKVYEIEVANDKTI